jgi:hypothetical protein
MADYRYKAVEKYRQADFATLLLISGDPMTRLLFAGSDQFANLGAFSTALYVGNLLQESEQGARQAGAALGPRPRLAAKVAAPSRRSSPNGCKGKKSRIARLGKQRDEVR